MKITIDTKKGAKAVSGFLQKTSDFGKRTISDVQAGATDLSEKMKQDSYQRRLKKYNPLFPDMYKSVSFNLPNMIMIRDDAERKGVDVCEGAVGWLGNESGMDERQADSGFVGRNALFTYSTPVLASSLPDDEGHGLEHRGHLRILELARSGTGQVGF